MYIFDDRYDYGVSRVAAKAALSQVTCQVLKKKRQGYACNDGFGTLSTAVRKSAVRTLMLGESAVDGVAVVDAVASAVGYICPGALSPISPPLSSPLR